MPGPVTLSLVVEVLSRARTEEQVGPRSTPASRLASLFRPWRLIPRVPPRSMPGSTAEAFSRAPTEEPVGSRQVRVSPAGRHPAGLLPSARCRRCQMELSGHHTINLSHRLAEHFLIYG